MLEAILISAALLFTEAQPDTLDVATVSAQAKAESSASTPMQRLTDKELRRSGAVYLYEAVRSLSGVSIKDYGGIGGLKTVSVRNLGAAHTFVSYDGFCISDAQNGQVDISRFLLDDIDLITVTIGPEDNIFRSARSTAGSGVLRIHSKAPVFHKDGKNECTAGVTIGSFGTYNPKIRYARKINDCWSLSATGSWLTSKGAYPFTLKNGQLISEEIRLNSDVNIINGELNLYGKLPKARGTITTKVNILNSERGLPGSVVLYSKNPTERLWDRSLLVFSRYENNFSSDWKIQATLSYSNAWNRYTNSSALYAAPQDNRYTQQECGISSIVQYSPYTNIRISLAEDLWGNSLESNIPECPYPRRLSSLTALSAQYLGSRLKATFTLTGTYINEQTLISTSAENRRHLSPSASISYGFLKNRLRIRTSYKDSYRVPTFNDLYYARVGNTSLLPEKAKQLNIGATWNSNLGDDFEIGLTADAYSNTIDDKITAIPTMFIWKMRNLGKVRMSGTDLSAALRWRVGKQMTLHTRTNFSYQHAVDITDPLAKNWKHQIPYTPRHTGNAIISAETPWVTATYTMNAVGDRYSLAQNIPANLIESYCDHSISLNRTFDSGPIQLHISIEALNLTDNNYEVIRYYPMPGRNYRLTIKIKY